MWVVDDPARAVAELAATLELDLGLGLGLEAEPGDDGPAHRPEAAR
jgi:hypothetical protein